MCDSIIVLFYFFYKYMHIHTNKAVFFFCSLAVLFEFLFMHFKSLARFVYIHTHMYTLCVYL